jgi:hypothetical protein
VFDALCKTGANNYARHAPGSIFGHFSRLIHYKGETGVRFIANFLRRFVQYGSERMKKPVGEPSHRFLLAL